MDDDEFMDDPGLVALWKAFRLVFDPWFLFLH